MFKHSLKNLKHLLGSLAIFLCAYNIAIAQNLMPKDFIFEKLDSSKSMNKTFQAHANTYITELKITSKYPSLHPIEIYSVQINEGKCEGYQPIIEKNKEKFEKIYNQNPGITLERLVAGQKARTEDKSKVIATLKNRMLSKDEWIQAFFRVASPCAIKDIQKVVIWGLFENEPFKVEYHFK
ncbi:hypothetical protein [Helicobacter cetorum]|uniref:Uncharacterized protein n=1 Tax=Helicobacter cetorum (strain ATCC BAA-429 / MIT 00-7128) TaxID=182217 RepID=I0EPB4_HELC0|nr:hypothetical protein [Helicobacter cetorum]AFI04783.1 hypothetical protein HCW_07625 [Helicobacter cetorum MIT 00-7128]